MDLEAPTSAATVRAHPKIHQRSELISRNKKRKIYLEEPEALLLSAAIAFEEYSLRRTPYRNFSAVETGHLIFVTYSSLSKDDGNGLLLDMVPESRFIYLYIKSLSSTCEGFTGLY